MTGFYHLSCGRPKLRTALLAAASMAALSPAAAWAQAGQAAPAVDEADSDDAIIVTARRRDESILETPIAVSVASGEDLRSNDVTFAPDLVKMTPGLTAQMGSSGSLGLSRRTSRFAIRGQGGGTGVVTYFAEVPSFGLESNFFDLDNVQVIKGPVGTLFGRVTTGGAVLFSPTKPSDEFAGFVDLKIGEYGRRDVEFAVGGPLIDNVLGLRVSGQLLKSNGFSSNRYNGGHLDGRDGQSFRAILEFTPTDSITNTTIAAVDYIEDPIRSGIPTIARPFSAVVNLGPFGTIQRGNLQRIAPALAKLNNITCPGGVCPTWLELAQGAVDDQKGRSVYDVNENNVTFPSVNQRQIGLINTTEFRVADFLTLKNIFSYQSNKRRGNSAQNVDSLYLPLLELVDSPGHGARSLTEEIQAQASLLDDRLDLTAGFFYEKNWSPYYQQSSVLLYGGYLGQASNAVACSLAGTVAEPGADGNFYCYSGARISLGKSRASDRAIYTQATFDVTDKLSLTAGYRYTWSKRSAAQASYSSLSIANSGLPTQMVQINGAAPFLIAGDIKSIPGETFQTLKFGEGTWSFAAQYQFNPDFMVYATTRRGYNPGGFNGANAPAGFEQYGPEIVTDYEIGTKYSWRNGPLRGLVSFDVYRDNFDNAQRNVTQPVNGNPVAYIANVAKIRIQGFDLDATVSYDWFTLGGFVTLTDAKYLEYPNTGQFEAFPIPFDLTIFRPANVSKWLWGIRPRIDFGKMIDGAPDISLSGNIYHRGSFSSSEPNVGVEAQRQIDGFTTADIRLDWANINDSGLSAAFAVTNLFDFNGKVGGNELRGTNGINIDVFSPPRQFYFELNYAF